MASTVLAVTDRIEDTRDSQTTPPLPVKTSSHHQTDPLFQSLGDLGDLDGLHSFHEQEKVAGRNLAEKLGNFWNALEKQGIPEVACIQLICDYFEDLKNQEELDEALFIHDEEED